VFGSVHRGSIARVVVGALDPNPKTAQAGVRRLREAASRSSLPTTRVHAS